MRGKEFEASPKIANGLKQGKLRSRATIEGDHNMHVVELGSKKKINIGTTCKTSKGDKEKKLRVDEEARSLGILFATHLGASEVAKQPC